MALYGYNLSFKVLLRVGGRVPDFNATSGPQLTAEADFSSVKLVSWGQVWQKCSTDLYKAFLWSELEVLRRSNKANDDMVIGATVLVEMLDE